MRTGAVLAIAQEMARSIWTKKSSLLPPSPFPWPISIHFEIVCSITRNYCRPLWFHERRFQYDVSNINEAVVRRDIVNFNGVVHSAQVYGGESSCRLEHAAFLCTPVSKPQFRVRLLWNLNGINRGWWPVSFRAWRIHVPLYDCTWGINVLWGFHVRSWLGLLDGGWFLINVMS